MFNVQTINCMQYSEAVVIQTRLHSRNVIKTHTEHLVQKHNNKISFNWKEAIWFLTKKTRKQERKADRIITLDGENRKKLK